MNLSEVQTLSTSAPGEPIKFCAGDGFQQTLRRRVESYFETTGRSERDCSRMYLKTAIVLGWFVASYIGLVFIVESWWLDPLMTISLGLSMAAIGFNIQHDGGHHSYSAHPWVNKVMAMSLDLLGGSSYVWNMKHNAVHHSFSNITGHDDDINIGFLGRLSPHQERWKFHRLQHFYLWVLYGFLPIKWQLYDNFRDVLIGRIGRYPFTRPKGWDLATGGRASQMQVRAPILE